jgi:hypothetical protein
MVHERGLLQFAMDELSSALSNAVGASSPIQHRLLKGEFRERRVIAGLRSFIPRRYYISSGVIANANGDFSLQQDIILSDSMTVPPVLAAGELGVHLIETVRAVIEVKSKATAQTMREAVKNIASVKRLMPNEPRSFMDMSGGGIAVGETFDKPFGGVIFLDSEAPDITIGNAFRDEVSTLAPNDRPNAVVVVNEFAILWGNLTQGSQALIEPQPMSATEFRLHRFGANALLAFYVVLTKVLADYQAPLLDLISYVNNSEGFGNHEALIYKSFKDNPTLSERR